jgi:hypothetical protein
MMNVENVAVNQIPLYSSLLRPALLMPKLKTASMTTNEMTANFHLCHQQRLQGHVTVRDAPLEGLQHHLQK